MKTIIIAGLISAIPLSCVAGEESKQATSKLAEEAPRTLRDTKSFIIGPAFEEGRITETETALRALLQRKDAIEQLRMLIKEASLPGQLYALLGLRLLGSDEFDAGYNRFKNSQISIPTMSGCIKFQTTAGDIAKKIKQGKIK